MRATRGCPGLAALVLIASLAGLSLGCLFGGGDDEGGAAGASGSIPTATIPAPLPEPIDLGGPDTVGGGDGGGQTTNPGETTYLVQPGDTLLDIALQFNVPEADRGNWIAQVLELNGLPSAQALQAGVEIRVPGVSTVPEPTAAPGTSEPTPEATAAETEAPEPTAPPSVVGGGGTYTVESGDYPLLIAEKLGVPVEERDAWAAALIALNGIDPTALSVGQVLELPEGTPGSGAAPTETPVP
jgi:LysM repeat protein